MIHEKKLRRKSRGTVPLAVNFLCKANEPTLTAFFLVQESLQSLTQSMSVGLRLALRRETNYFRSMLPGGLFLGPFVRQPRDLIGKT